MTDTNVIESKGTNVQFLNTHYHHANLNNHFLNIFFSSNVPFPSRKSVFIEHLMCIKRRGSIYFSDKWVENYLFF